MKEGKKMVSLDALALTGPDLPLSGVVIDARHISRGDVVDMVIGQCEEALKAKIKALDAEAERLTILTADEIRGMISDKPLKLDHWGVRNGHMPVQLHTHVDFPTTGAIYDRFQKASKLFGEADAYKAALQDLTHGKTAKRAILKKFLMAHPEGKSAIEQIELFGSKLLEGLQSRVAAELEG